jgi:site-specific DNA-methyltransferase (adenine-specific)
MEDKHSVVFLGDIRECSEHLSDDFFSAIVTSPPYFGHRKYTDNVAHLHEIGREDNVADYVNTLVSVFSLLRPKLRGDGLLWLNLGDTYRDKALLSVPWKVALALQDDGWILRSDVIWHKPNAMPSSVKDRPTTDHEYVFMFSKNTSYFYNADAIREEHVTFTDRSKMQGGRKHFGENGKTPEQGKNKGNSNLHTGNWESAFNPLGRNKRTVWSIPLSKFREAHFAVFPEKLAELCILSSTKVGDYVLDPFAGSGTTGVVACRNQRYFIGVELVREYQEMASRRVFEASQQISLFSFVDEEAGVPAVSRL